MSCRFCMSVFSAPKPNPNLKQYKLFKYCRHEIMLEKNKDEVHNYVLDWLDNNL